MSKPNFKSRFDLVLLRLKLVAIELLHLVVKLFEQVQAWLVYLEVVVAGIFDWSMTEFRKLADLNEKKT